MPVHVANVAVIILRDEVPGQLLSGERYFAGAARRKTLHTGVSQTRRDKGDDGQWAPGLLATHTLNMAGDLAVIDGCRRRCKFCRLSPQARETAG
jgi:hypothetical protein